MENTMKRIILAIVLIASATLCYAESNQSVVVQSVVVTGGFLTGNSFRDLSDTEKHGYAMGFIDGVLISPIFNAPGKELQWFERCIKGMTNKQVVAILNKFLEENPARWHEPMNILAFRAMVETCKK